MVLRLLEGCAVMALCVIIHAGGVTWAIRRLRRMAQDATGFWRGAWLFIRVAVLIVLLHLAEISVWAALYLWNDAMPDVPSAMYFSAVTYTTTGYGDLVLPQIYRLHGGIEALTGILMCGWSTAFFLAIVNRLYERQP